MDKCITNWFGECRHPTDSMISIGAYIDGSDPKIDKDTKKKAKELRKAYDKIKKAGFEKELDYLLSASYESGMDNMSNACNEDL